MLINIWPWRFNLNFVSLEYFVKVTLVSLNLLSSLVYLGFEISVESFYFVLKMVWNFKHFSLYFFNGKFLISLIILLVKINLSLEGRCFSLWNSLSYVIDHRFHISFELIKQLFDLSISHLSPTSCYHSHSIFSFADAHAPNLKLVVTTPRLSGSNRFLRNNRPHRHWQLWLIHTTFLSSIIKINFAFPLQMSELILPHNLRRPSSILQQPELLLEVFLFIRVNQGHFHSTFERVLSLIRGSMLKLKSPFLETTDVVSDFFQTEFLGYSLGMGFCFIFEGDCFFWEIVDDFVDGF